MVFADSQEGEEDMSHYTHLTIEEREKLYLMKAQGEKIRQIAAALGRAPSTISRELHRNQHKSRPYSPSAAQRRYQKRRENCGRKHILSSPEKRERIRYFIQELHWSPEEISNRLKLEENPLQLSYSAIYRAINAGLFDVKKTRIPRRKRFSYQLRRKGKRKHKKGERNKQGQFHITHTISERPDEANNRTVSGHFEADTMVGKRGGACLVTLVDRKERIALAKKSPNASAPAVRDVLIELLSQLPPDMNITVTPDRGSEFALYQEVSDALPNVTFYFADPYSPWQRGTNENTNGLIREFLPKGTDITQVPDQDIADFISLLNKRPRKCLAWRSPFERFFGNLLHLT